MNEAVLRQALEEIANLGSSKGWRKAVEIAQAALVAVPRELPADPELEKIFKSLAAYRDILRGDQR